MNKQIYKRPVTNVKVMSEAQTIMAGSGLTEQSDGGYRQDNVTDAPETPGGNALSKGMSIWK